MADDHEDVVIGRRTAPMSNFGGAAVRIGFIVLVIGALLAFGIPLILL